MTSQLLIRAVRSRLSDACREAAAVLILEDPVTSALAEATADMATGRQGTAWNLIRELCRRHKPAAWRDNEE